MPQVHRFPLHVKRLLTLALLVLFVVRSASLRADYPIVSHRYLADPGSLVLNGRVYLYCSNDDENAVEGGYVMKSIVCVSSSDLKNWTDHGIVFRVPTNAAWASNAWAPAAIERNGRVFLYFGNNASGIGVASSPSPIGPFTDAKGSVLVNTSTPGAAGTNMWLFDPAVFIDDDGQAYLYFGGNGIANARVIKLNADMISTSGAAVAISTPNFFEASWIHKRHGIYYLSYSSNPSSGLTIDYLTSSNPMTGFTYAGTVAGQPPSNNNNNHHAIFQLGDKWYHAYHNRSVATQAGIPTTYRRNLGIEALNYNADETIQRVVYTTDGLPQLAPVNPYLRQEAEMTNAQNGIETEVCSASGMNVRLAQDGAWCRVRGVDFGAAGAATVTASVASGDTGGRIEIRLGSDTGTLVGTLVVPGTGGWQTWTNATAAISGAAGLQDVYFKFKADGTGQANLDWWQFTPVKPAIVVEPPDKIVFPGSTLVLSVEAAGTGNSYQWFRDGASLAGQTQSRLSIANAAAADTGAYTVRITNATGTTVSRQAAVQVTPDATRLINMSCRTQVNAGQIVSPGFYIAGTGTKQVLIRAAGPALGAFGVPTTMPDPQLKLYHGTEVIAQNDNWDAAAIGGAFDRVGAFGFAANSRDAALLATLPAGQPYTVQVSGVDGSSGIVLIEVYDADGAAATSRLMNVSVRGSPGAEAAKLVLGFVMRGEGARTLLVRGAGPKLKDFLVPVPLPDPQLTIYDADSHPLMSNDGWGIAPSPAALDIAADAVGAFHFDANSRDAATLAVLSPAAYTVQVNSTSSAAGEAVAEVYEVP